MFEIRLPRLFFWLLITVALTLAVAYLAPYQLTVTLYKISLVSLAAVLGYWIDRAVFPYARPHQLMSSKDVAGDCATIRRVILMSAIIIAIALGA
ncbi:putative holin [Neptunomonas antarctica]|uniref:Putative 2/3 transmembrane domain holin n=1 Tax=Neptunomonas antarctica TaxID=619304 RepID=A0A1N7MQ14_9GAMM|nr:putative holin [Neptunomonas antarctica]SIS88140.1 Putative 2/3 transmembrane domain holin [Neptunomonas antarctica]